MAAIAQAEADLAAATAAASNSFSHGSCCRRSRHAHNVAAPPFASGLASFPRGVYAGLSKWIRSAPPECKFKFGLAKTKASTRTVVPASVVQRATGTYLLKTHGGEKGEATTATPEQVRSLWCAIAPEYIVPNINANNMRVEYSPPPAPAAGA